MKDLPKVPLAAKVGFEPATSRMQGLAIVYNFSEPPRPISLLSVGPSDVMSSLHLCQIYSVCLAVLQ